MNNRLWRNCGGTVYLLYDLILAFVALMMVPYYLARRAFGLKARDALRERFACYAPGRLAPLAGRPVLWVHAVSVGETRAAIPLLKGLKATFPDHALLVTNVTETGHATTTGLAEVDLALYFPFDLSWVVRRALRVLAPQLIIIVETEIWPNLVRIAAAGGVPVMLVNGRISDRSFPRYQRLRFVLQPILERMSALCMQSSLDADRILRLGARPATVMTSANLKFDMPASLLPAGDQAHWRNHFRLPRELPGWVAGSTHAGEEELLLDVHRRLLDRGHAALLVLVPRHPDRSAAVMEQIQRAGFRGVRRSSLTSTTSLLSRAEVLLVDTIGEMLGLYAAADVVFVGGSLVPVGGHNILEAALLGKPVLFGPHMHNFRDIARQVLDCGAGWQVATADELGAELVRLLGAPEQATAAGQAGQALIAENAGATQRTIAMVRDLLAARS